MPKKLTSALDALARHEEQQEVVRETGERLRRAAALELGSIVLGAGGAILGLDGLRLAIAAAVAERRVDRDAGRPARTKESSHG